MNTGHFEELKARINRRLIELEAPHRAFQIERCSWLYGALGAVPSEVMLICENPSIAGLRTAVMETIDGGPPDMEAQWWGGRSNPAAKRFRVVLHELGLKATPPVARGGWNCYITNLVKEANVAGADQRSMGASELQRQARAWADILSWELQQVRPRYVFAVGAAAHKGLNLLQRENLLPAMTIHPIAHYSARGSDAKVMRSMLEPLRAVLRK